MTDEIAQDTNGGVKGLIPAALQLGTVDDGNVIVVLRQESEECRISILQMVFYFWSHDYDLIA